MSHVVEIQTMITDLEALTSATRRMQLPPPCRGEVQLFSSKASGYAVPLKDWRYPVVCDVESGQVAFDNFGGRWGKQEELDRLFQNYAIEKAKIEARRQGHSVHEQPLQDGSVKLTVNVGGTA
ncbi:MAG: DUF1257 domain-containing protein [Planctomycetaceae bacterium]|nr:DUF1257 domain-containing protein [Planctomycetales bacterium]MCB9926452.1 DUF1257 domain-containing protein [Planctomycetaceae bacterium]